MSDAVAEAGVCVWSNRPDPDTRLVTLEPAGSFEQPRMFEICPEHEPLLRGHLERLQRTKTQFFAALGAVFISALAPLFIESTLGLALPLTVLGTTLIVYPYAAPLTVERNGVAGAIMAVRAFGIVLLGFGLLFAGLAFA